MSLSSSIESNITSKQINSINESDQNLSLIINQNNEKDIKEITNETREIETLTDICSSDNLAEVDVISLLDENIPKYKLRADTIFSHSNCDWIRAPLYIDEQEISELTNEQISFTLDYFILSGYRVSQMTKTYYDIEAVTKLLDEKERDLELAATIGKQLLEKDQQLEVKIEILEQELEKTTEMVNQLRYEINLKDNLLKSFIDNEEDCLYLDNQVLNNQTNNKKLADINLDTLNEYKRKINYLESENDTLRNKAEYFERETADLESKESHLIVNCFKELEVSQTTLRTTQNELQTKTTECLNQQEEINNLFTQIFELQLRIKNLKQDNNDLQSVHESTKTELLDQINELKEKYNECLQLLSKSQEEISILRKKSNNNNNNNNTSTKRSTLTQSTSTSFNLNNIQETPSLINSADMTYYDEDTDLDSSFYKPTSILTTKSTSLYSPWMPLNQSHNRNSLAAELFTSMAKDYRTSNLSLQASQSSEFIKKVKQKLTKQIPGSNLESCLQSDSELEMMLTNSNNDFEHSNLNHNQNILKRPYLSKFTNCPTPDSILSTGSASLYSNLFARSNSFLLPEKLQIVKPIEGSQTLQHWQYLATPNLGCLFENRPGISIKGNQSDSEKNSDKCENIDVDDGVYEDDDIEDYDYDYDHDSEEFYKNYINNNNDDSSHLNTNLDDNFKQQYSKRVLSPSKVELLTKLLENEEKNQTLNSLSSSKSYDSSHTNSNQNTIFVFFKNISNKYFRSNSLEHDDEDDNNYLNENNNVNNKMNKKNRHEYDDPDTPPSSPINLPQSNNNNNLFEFARVKLVDSLSNYFKPAPTPPGTPTIGLELENDLSSSSEESFEEFENNGSKMQNFFDQIINKLSMFTFKTVDENNNNNKNNDKKKIKLVKPSPIYATNDSKINSECYLQDDEELVRIEENRSKKLIECNNNEMKKCATPPPSPSKFSPPLPDLELPETYTEEDIKKSAFIKVTSLNPYINQSVDLASLLGSLSSLKRSQRLYV